ncbi:TetR/AcrR family transcriptional regulator [Agarivorans sp. MS3-6]|uniref:TetR/AcrR family transcriptional regulator n=1 Tax=Agarivorans sp. TSD2052 TaxID=2937286 RepID=UPI00200BAA89|nr:TetR/AcrR family transcriptional regulator [Agarivorans sp. TSD2052]UPW18962.1 TetR/AcrR family transcriptional regulator [Agarivorans sp. TSD2052]
MLCYFMTASFNFYQINGLIGNFNFLEVNMENYVVPDHLAMRNQPSQERTRRLVEDILDNTLVLIKEQGLAAVNTNLIAQSCAIDIASLYRFFKNKEAIFFALAHRWFKKVQRVVEESNFQQAVGNIVDYANSGQIKINALAETEVMLVSFHELFTHDKDFKALENWHRSILIEHTKASFRQNGSNWDDEALTSVCLYLYGFTRNFMAGTIGITAEELHHQFAWYQIMLDRLRELVLKQAVPTQFLR